MKSVVILHYTEVGEPSRPPLEKKYLDVYETWYQLARQRGIQLSRASFRHYDKSRKLFTTAWTFDGIWKEIKNIKPDLVDDRCKALPSTQEVKELIRQDTTLMNDPLFNSFIDNKFLVANFFRDWSPRTKLVTTSEELKDSVNDFPGEKVVLKSISGTRGKEVFIGGKQQAVEAYTGKPSIVQEYLESAEGIPGVYRGRHDLRVVFLNDDILYTFIRYPAEGKLLANLHQGGGWKLLEISQLPQTMDPIITRARELFHTFEPKLYTIDFIFSGGRPYVIEMNSMPGMYFPSSERAKMQEVYGKLTALYANYL